MRNKRLKVFEEKESRLNNDIVSKRNRLEIPENDSQYASTSTLQENVQHSNISKDFINTIFEVPHYICHSGHKRCYQNQITRVRDEEKYLKHLGDFNFGNWTSKLVNNCGLWFCNYCYSFVKTGNSPPTF